MDSSDDDFNECEGDEIQSYSYLCLMCDHCFDEMGAMMTHISLHHKVDVKTILKHAKISNDYDWIKIINFLRKNKEGVDMNDITSGIWKDDIYLKPQIADDSLLFIDYETIVESVGGNDTNDILQKKIDDLEDVVSTHESTIAVLRQKVAELLNCEDDSEKMDTSDSVPNSKASKLTEEDNAYFTSYSHYSIHDTMIKDTVRTDSYRRFIEENGRHYFQDKIVLDVGCGTGILSMFAARAGAAHVYAVDCADIIYDAMAIVEKNGLKDKITLIHGKLEEVRLPCETKVDIVISEWMGYFLIYESMLDSVLYACRQYLNPHSGMVFPRYFTLNLVGADMSAFRAKTINCWDSVFGFDMSSMKMNVTKEVVIEVVPAEDVVTDSVVIRDYDVQKMISDPDCACPQVIEQAFELTVTKTGTLGAIVAYFDTYFMSPSEAPEEQVMFSTGPAATSTHWQQTVLLLNEPMTVTAGQVVSGVLNVGRHSQGKRGLKFSLKIGDILHQNYEFS